MKALLLSLFAGLMLFSTVAVPVSAQSVKDEACRGANLGASSNCQDTGFKDTFLTIINGIIFLVGAISILMIVIGAFRFVVSAGNEQAVAGARGTIAHAVIGLIVAFAAYAIVNFVIDRIGN